MMEAVRCSGYSGPIGILGHRDDMDAEVSLRQNLDGTKQVLEQIGDRAAPEDLRLTTQRHLFAEGSQHDASRGSRLVTQ